jgi:DNA polymerase-3 subunit delta'
MNLNVHPDNILELDAAAAERHQSVLLTSPPGFGMIESAEYLAHKLKAQITHVRPVDRRTGAIDMANGKIIVPLIRQLYESTRSKITSPQVIIIHASERMTASAQNAFLKLLEEPRPNFHFVMLSEQLNRLLPTILSRLTKIHLRPITQAASNDILDKLGVVDSKKRQQIMFMAAGLPRELQTLATDELYFTKEAAIMADAKTMLTSDSYHRLLQAGSYREDRDGAVELVNKALIITKLMLKTNPSDQLVEQLGKLLSAKEQLELNGNVRLSLMRGVLQ